MEDIFREMFFLSDGVITDVRMGVDKEIGDFCGYVYIEFVSDGDLECVLLRDGEEFVGGWVMKVTYATARK